MFIIFPILTHQNAPNRLFEISVFLGGPRSNSVGPIINAVGLPILVLNDSFLSLKKLFGRMKNDKKCPQGGHFIIIPTRQLLRCVGTIIITTLGCWFCQPFCFSTKRNVFDDDEDPDPFFQGS